MRRDLACLVAFGLALVACGNDGSPAASTPESSIASSAGGEAPEALRLTAPLVGGGTIDLSQYAGTTVALWFWAPT